jgi:hypothetical protein
VGLLAIIALLGASSFVVGCVSAVALIGSLERHGLFIAGLAALTSAVVVGRRRVRHQTEGPRSWLAALPVDPSTARWEAVAIDVAPVGIALLGLALAFGAVGAVCARAPGFSAGSAVDASLGVVIGACLGAVVSYLMPARRRIDLPPGSRYVPHRQTSGTAPLRPTLAPLGHWPIRQMFASAQPRAVARAALPVLLCLPAGMSPAAALTAIAVIALLGLLLLLVIAVISVSGALRLWLAPLPLAGGAAARALLLPPLLVAAALSALASSLLWVAGLSPATSADVGLFTAIASWCVALGGHFIALAHPNGRRERP